MIVAFLGYVLPWGQISFWGATVITNLFRVIPYLGPWLVEWIWGGFSIGDATLKRFFVLHFLMPFVIVGIVIVHMIFLHETGSNNPLGVFSEADKVAFSPYFVYKDLVGFIIFISLYFFVIFFCGDLLLDPENFLKADPIHTPAHIQPEWYFLFAYTILRSVPRKVGGVLALAFSVLILYFLPIINF